MRECLTVSGQGCRVLWCHIQHSLKIHPEHRADTRGGEEVEGADSEEGRAGMEWFCLRCKTWSRRTSWLPLMSTLSGPPPGLMTLSLQRKIQQDIVSQTQDDTEVLHAPAQHNDRAVLTPEDLGRWHHHTRILVAYHYNINDQQQLGSELFCVSVSLAFLKWIIKYTTHHMYYQQWNQQQWLWNQQKWQC